MLPISDNFHEKMHFTKSLLQDIKPHVVNHGILTKLSSLIHLYSIFLQFPNNELVSSTKILIWNHEINENISDNWKETLHGHFFIDLQEKVNQGMSVWFLLLNKLFLSNGDTTLHFIIFIWLFFYFYVIYLILIVMNTLLYFKWHKNLFLTSK